MKRALMAIGLTLLSCVPAFARPAVITGRVVQENEQRVVTGLNWTTSLNQALNQAQREGKMVLWVHMLGDISGAT